MRLRPSAEPDRIGQLHEGTNRIRRRIRRESPRRALAFEQPARGAFDRPLRACLFGKEQHGICGRIAIGRHAGVESPAIIRVLGAKKRRLRTRPRQAAR
jgi:hypothetical protein